MHGHITSQGITSHGTSCPLSMQAGACLAWRWWRKPVYRLEASAEAVFYFPFWTCTERRSPYLSRAPRCALDRRHIADSAYSTFRRCAGAARPSAFSTSATTNL